MMIGKKKEVKAIDLFFLAILSFTPHLLDTKAFPSLSWLTYLFISILFLEEYLEKKIIGTADWIVLFSISFRLSLSQIPFFLALSVFFGIITYFIKK